MSGYIGVLPVPQTTQTRESFTATAGQTSFGTSGYQIDHLDVYLNGVKLAAADYTATNGSDIVLTSGAAVNDILEMVAFETFTIANQSFTGTTTVDTLVVTNTVDGRDVSVDGAKLDTIPIISTSSTPSFTAKSDGTTDGYIQLNCSQNSHGIKLKSPPHSANASYTLTFPNDDGNAGQFLKTDGSGGLSWATDSTTDSTKLPLAGGAMTGAITTNSTFDGVDVATRDAVLTSTTTTAGAALPKAGGALTGAVTTNSTFDGRDVAADGVTADAALPKAGGAMTGVLSVPDGSTSSPSIANTGDLDTGISFPAINSIAISTAGTQRLIIDSTGFFDVTATGDDLARFSGLNSGSLVIRNDTANQVVVHTGTSDSLVFGTGGNNDRLTITNSGNIGIGHASPTAPLDIRISGASGRIAEFHNTSGFGVDIGSDSNTVAYISGGYTQALAFKTNAGSGQVERLRITSSGLVGIGTSSPSSQIGGAANLVIGGTSDADSGMTFVTSTSGQGLIHFSDATSGNGRFDGFIGYEQNNQAMKFGTAQAERMRIDSSGNLLVGKSTANIGLVGQEFRGSGSSYLTSTNDTALGLNRLSSDGTVLEIRKDSSVVGSIGSVASGANLFISAASGVGLGIGGDNIYPVNASGASTNGSLDIGDASARFKNLYLSGTANVDTKIVLDNLSSDYYGTSFQINNTNADFSGALLDMRATSGNVNSANGRFLRCYSNNGSSEKFHVKGSGEIYTAAGILLGGTGTANKLEDYEEGTWTPTVSVGFANPGYSVLFGQYIKVGRLVTAYWRVIMNAGTPNNARVRISGLPYTSVNNANVYEAATHYFSASASEGVNSVILQVPNSTILEIYKKNATNVTSVVGNALGNTVSILGQITYQSST